MARTNVPATVLFGSVNPANVQLVYIAADTVNHHSTASTGREVIVVRNVSGGTSHTVTLRSFADSQGRTGDVAVSVAPSEVYVFGPLAASGWKQEDGTIWIDVDHADLRIAVIQGAG